MAKIIIYSLIFIIIGCTSTSNKRPPEARIEDYSSFYSLFHVKMTYSEVENILKNIKSPNCQGKFCEYAAVKTKTKVKIIPYNTKNIKQLQNNSWEFNQKSIKFLKEGYWSGEFSKIAKHEQCPKNLNAAIIKKLDDNLEEKNIYSTLDKYYQDLNLCPPMMEHELIHLRMAIIYYKNQENEKAQKAINNALSVVKDEYTRINYWAGVILNQEEYFKKVVYNRPYSYHAVKAAEKLSIDLIQVLKSRPIVQESRPELANLVEALLFYKKEKEAYNLINNNLNKFSLEEMLYWVKLFSFNKQLDYTIRLVSRSYILNPEKFSFNFIEYSYNTDYKKEFEKYSNLADPYLMLSLSKQESGFNPKAQSPARAKGLMQIIPSTAKYVSKSKAKDLFNPDNNIFIGVNYFNELTQIFKKPEYALAAYNAGPRPVQSWIKHYPYEEDIAFMDLIPYRETRIYVSSILRNYYFYKNLK